MTTNLIDLRDASRCSPDDFAALQAILAQLIGEPYRFARVSYGDELTLHFGDLRAAQSAKLHKRLYGAFILGLRGSPWILKSGSEPLVLTAGVSWDFVTARFGKSISKEELETKQFIEPESRVLAAVPFVIRPVNGVALQIQLSDGSSLSVLPTLAETEERGEDELPELADWELISPRGLLSVGPGLKWSFQPAAFQPRPTGCLPP